MSSYSLIAVFSDTTPSTETTEVGSSATGLDEFQEIHIEADLVGATGGTLDVYIQRKLADDLWRDWIHFPTISAGGGAVKYSVPPGYTKDIYTVGGGTDASPGIALAADTFVGGHPGNTIRAVYDAGPSTSAGTGVTIRVLGLDAG